MHIALVVVNLLGDSLYLLKPVQHFIDAHPDDTISIIAQKNTIAGELFEATFKDSRVHIYYDLEAAKYAARDEVYKEIKLSAGEAGTVAFGPKQLHISEAYAKMLGVECEDVTPLTAWQQHPDVEREYVLLSPFSRSCSGHSGEVPNKTLDDWKWEHVIRFFRKHDYVVKIIGSKGDRLQNVSIPECDYLYARNLVEMETIIRKAHLVVSIDNGISNMASSIGMDVIVLWPECSSIEFIAPLFSPRTAICKIGNPNVAQPVQLLAGIKSMMSALAKRSIYAKNKT